MSEERPASEPAPLASAVESVLRHASRSPQSIALIGGCETLSYRDLARRVRHTARALQLRGVRRGDRVVLPASSTPDFVVSYLAVHLAGGVAVPSDAGMPRARVEHIGERVAARLALTVEEQRSLCDVADGALADPEPAFAVRGAGPEIADIMFTSGTTGAPKGVMLSHRNLAAAARHINAFVGTSQADVEVLALPLGHSFGLGTIRCVLSAGGAVVLVDGFAFPGRIFAALEEHRATGFRCVAAGLAMMLKFAPDRLADFSTRIRYVELGSAPMRTEDKHRLMSLLPRSRICMHYGLTEATRSAYIEFHVDRARLDSIGRPSHGVEIRLVGSAGGMASPGEPGEIQIRGPHVMSGYWQDTERTRSAFDGDWLRTGDAGHVDEGGYLYLHGRKADMINVGGRKVAPAEIEEALRRHPAVLDCGCSGIADPAGISGDAVGVLVLLREGPAVGTRELREHLRASLEPYKLPVKWLFAGTIPRTENGKVQRHLLRELLERASE
jgi:long-chain acyl-CoA synthetase